LLDAIQDAEGHPLLTIMRARNTPGVVWPTYRGNSSTDLPTYAGALFAGNITSVFDRYGRQIYYHTGTYADTASPPAYPQSFQGLDYVSQLTPSSLYSRLVNGNYSDCPNPQNWGIATDYFCRDLTATSQYRPTQNSPNAPPARYIYGYQNISNLYGQETVPFLHALTVPSPQQDTTSLSYSTALINYDPKTDLVSSVTDGNGNSRAYTSIDYGDTQVSFLDTSGNTVFSHTVSFDGNMGEVSDTDGTNKTLIYSATYADPNDPYMPSTVLDGNGSANGGTTGKTLMTWDQYGNLRTRTSLRKIGSYPVVTTNTWDYAAFPLGRLMSIQVLGKNPTTFDYWEPSGLPKTITYPSPGGPGGSDIGQSTQQESFTYDAFGNILTITTPKNGYTRTGLQTATITTTFNYNNPSTGVSAVCEPISVSDNAGHVTQYRYDEQGNVTAFFDSLNHETDATYNIANQRTYIAFPATNRNGYGMRQSSATFAYAYPSGPENCETSFDELGHQVHVAYSGYDLEGQPINVHGSGVQPSSCQYDAAGRRVTLTDGNNQTTRYYYNAAGYSDAVTYPGYAGPTPAYDQVSGTWSNVSGPDSTRVAAYDNDGNPTRCVDGNGREVDYTYNDPDSLLTDVNFIADSSLNVHYHYDSYGRQDTVRDSTGSRSYVFDDDDNVTQATTYYIGAEAYGASGHTISYHFYGDGSRSSMTTPAGNFWYQYDSANHLQSVTGPNSVGASWTYYDNSQLKQQTLSNGVTTTYTYDAKGALSRQSNTDQNGLQFSSFTSLTYDGADNQTGVTAYLAPPQGIYGPGAYTNKTYSYDSHDQLTSENRTQSSMPNGTYFGQYAINYVYDNNAPSGNGNATTFRNNATTYDADNQLKSFNGNNGFQYDGNGNPVKYQATSLNFDAQDNLTLINGRLSASYRSDGLRASKLDPSSGNRQWFLYDGSELLCELDSTGNVTAWNLWGANGLAARETGGTAYNNAKAFNTYYRVVAR